MHFPQIDKNDKTHLVYKSSFLGGGGLGGGGGLFMDPPCPFGWPFGIVRRVVNHAPNPIKHKDVWNAIKAIEITEF